MKVIHKKSRSKEDVNLEYRETCEQLGDAVAHVAQWEIKIAALKQRSFQLFEEFRVLEERDSEIAARIAMARQSESETNAKKDEKKNDTSQDAQT